MNTVRVRIAPSPTGFFHIGNAKTALINWLFARKMGGTFILRLEDTDTERSKPEYSHIILDALAWLGINWDEGPGIGGEPERGEYGPYRQALRRDIHVHEAERLIAEGKAYKCFHSPEELEAQREQARAEKRPPRVISKWRDASPEEVEAMGDAPYAIRFRVPEGETVINDLVQGQVRSNNKEFDDFVIVKPNGDPIFHLAVVVDDGLMKITHVIRGDDHLTNCFRHIMLFEALGYELPLFAHLPMVVDEAGKKYSKRLHGANLLDWRDDGYLPETLLNYLVLLGWTPAEEGREIFTKDELAEAFDISRLGSSPGKFDRKKLDWLNGQHIRRLTPVALRDRVLPILHKAGFDTSKRTPEWLARMAQICQEKIPTLNDIVAYTDFFFVEPEVYEEKGVEKHWRKEGVIARLESVYDMLESAAPFTHEAIKIKFEAKASETGGSFGQYVHPTRLALTGKSVGPGLFELVELLGQDACLRRVSKAIDFLEQMEDGTVE